MSRLLRLGLVAGLMLTACDDRAGRTHHAPDPESPAPSSRKSASRETSFLGESRADRIDPGPITGLLTWGHEVRAFAPCGEDRELWVTDESDGELGRARESADLEPYEARLVVIEGWIGEAPTDGFGAEYDGSIRVTALSRFGAAGELCP